MSKQTFHYLVSGTFFLIAAAHLLRVVYKWEAIIADVTIPVWFSWGVVVLAGYLGYLSYSFGKKL